MKKMYDVSFLDAEARYYIRRKARWVAVNLGKVLSNEDKKVWNDIRNKFNVVGTGTDIALNEYELATLIAGMKSEHGEQFLTKHFSPLLCSTLAGLGD